MFANLTYSFSKVTLSGTTSGGQATSVNRPLQGQSPYLANLGLQYNSKKGEWSGSALYNRIGQRLSLVGNQDFADIYERPRNQVDFQLAKKVMKSRGEVKLTWADILNNPYYFYENVDSKKHLVAVATDYSIHSNRALLLPLDLHTISTSVKIIYQN